MERCIDSEYQEIQPDSSESSQTWTDVLCHPSRCDQEKTKIKKPAKVPRARKKIAGDHRSDGRADSRTCPGGRPNRSSSWAEVEVVEDADDDGKRVKKLNVLKQGRWTTTATATATATATSAFPAARQSVQKNTKTLHRNVPDRIGKYVNSNVRSKGVTKSEHPSLDESSLDAKTPGVVDRLLLDCPDTKLNMIGNECLSNKESVTLGSSIESDSETHNIFEKIFDDCLGSTSVVVDNDDCDDDDEDDASSQETPSLEADEDDEEEDEDDDEEYDDDEDEDECKSVGRDERMVKNETTPAKKDRIQEHPPKTPVKVKDHTGYYGHKKLRHVCGYCHKIFKSNGKLNSHVYSHTGERPFDCSHCGKAFSSKFKLVRHLLIHSEVRKFVCQICDRTFLRNDHLKNHYKIHDPQKKMYTCSRDNCDKKYSSMMSHKKHMAYHSVEDGDLKCLICGVKFETKEEVLFHLKSHSGSRLFKTQSDKKFKCEFCDRLFLTRKDVTRHLVVHTGERDFLCQFCPQRFGRKDHLVRHIKKSHTTEEMTAKDEIKRLTEVKKKPATKSRAVEEEATTSSHQPEEKKEESIDVVDASKEPEEKKTHIVITVKNPAVQKRKWKPVTVTGSKGKSFRKSEASVANKRQVAAAKGKSSTTQIFLQNIPNILIIPNNSIILLRNQSETESKKDGDEEEEKEEDMAEKKVQESVMGCETKTSVEEAVQVPQVNLQERFQMAEELIPSLPVTEESTPAALDCGFTMSYSYPPFQPQQQQIPQQQQTQSFPAPFTYSEPLSNFQTDMMSFDSINFEMLTQTELRRGDDEQEGLPSEATDLQRKIGIVKPITKPLSDMDKEDLFASEESLLLTDSILNEFKVDDPVPLGSDLFDQGGSGGGTPSGGSDAPGSELLRSLLMSETPILSPLPGFSQIFNNTNPN